MNRSRQDHDVLLRRKLLRLQDARLSRAQRRCAMQQERVIEITQEVTDNQQSLDVFAEQGRVQQALMDDPGKANDVTGLQQLHRYQRWLAYDREKAQYFLEEASTELVLVNDEMNRRRNLLHQLSEQRSRYVSRLHEQQNRRQQLLDAREEADLEEVLQVRRQCGERHV